MSSDKTVSIGGACGYWGDSAMATPQFLEDGNAQYIVFDYLAEITMSIMARAKAKDPKAGYATDFISAVLKPNLSEIANKSIKLVANAGGVNPQACGAAARKLISELGLDLKVAVISGDDLLDQTKDIADKKPVEMFTGETFPDPDKVASINAYLGAFPIAHALTQGADIIITGRCVDSAVTLGICIYEFEWSKTDYDLLASGSLAGHIIECGPQATGGNFTDWELAGNIADIGYPIATINADGSFEITKPKNTAGVVSVGTVCEQMLYEIGDPQAYILPDVICDFSEVSITQSAPDRVFVSPAKGYPAPDTYKTCVTYADGFRTGMMFTHYGFDAARKAKSFAEAGIERARKTLRQHNMQEFSEVSIEIIGAGSQYGEFNTNNNPQEVVTKIAVKHPSIFEGGVLLKELAGLGLASAPGLSGFQGARPKPSPVVRLFSYLTPKTEITSTIEIEDTIASHTDDPGKKFDKANISRPAAPPIVSFGDTINVPLLALAWGRSGDKGNKANIGIIARKAEYLPWIWAALEVETVADKFAHFIENGTSPKVVERFFLPGSNAINFLIDNVLGGGGVASIRNDPQGKGYAQILLTHPIPIASSIASKIT